VRALSLLAAGALIASANTARADQCAKNPKAIAEAAAALVQKGSRVIEYCEPCGDAAPGAPYTVRSVLVRDGQLFVEGSLVDLAYLFVDTGSEFMNVGLRTQCGATSVSRAIRGGRPTGPVDAKPPTRPGQPPSPPPPAPRSPGELTGTWSVRFTTRASSCPAATQPTTAEWTIAYTNGVFDLRSDDGSELSGPLDPGGPRSVLRATLKAKRAPSATVVRLTMFKTDHYIGTLVHGEATSRASDPICVTWQDIDAKRR
jgi:hypothetical protein